MKSIFDKADHDELIKRIQTLDENSTAQWGQMTIYQMLKHCTLWEDMIQGKKQSRRMLLGRLIGPMILKKIISDEKPMQRNAPTVPGFAVNGNGDMHEEKKKWLAMMEEHADFSNPGFVHPFFGKMTKEQIGRLAYKHTDHHLRQFNV